MNFIDKLIKNKMGVLQNKNIYVLLSGARKVFQMPYLLKEITSEGANTYTLMTQMGNRLANLSDFNFYGNAIALDYSPEGEKLPLEDLFVIAPCTFNTLNKIANGIADTYPLTLAATAIGAGRKVILAPAMNNDLWNHPVTQNSINKIKSWGGQIIWPEIIENNVTMAPIEKIIDSIYHNLVGPTYVSSKIELDQEYKDIINKNFLEFKLIGKRLLENHLTNGSAGCLSKKISEGILITSSGSHIGNLSKEELCLIKDIKRKEIFWQGFCLPSSETPLISELYENVNESSAIIHSHCPRITYDSKMEKYTTSTYVRYGQFGLNEELINLVKMNSGFAILKLHGELSVGESLEQALSKLIQKMEEAHG